MSHALSTPRPHALSTRPHALVTRVEAWAHRGRGRAIVVKIGVTVFGPLLVVAGLAMTVLPGPGLVVAALGMALLALEYAWARRALGLAGRLLSWARAAALPRDGSRGRRLLGVLTAAGFVAATTVLTGVVTTFVGAQAVL